MSYLEDYMMMEAEEFDDVKNDSDEDNLEIADESFDMIAEYLQENGISSEDFDTYSVYNEAQIYTGKEGGHVFRTKEAFKNQVMAMSAIAAAKEKKDPKIAKLQKINKQRRMLIDQIVKQYSSAGRKGVKKALKGAKKTSTLKKSIPSNKVTAVNHPKKK